MSLFTLAAFAPIAGCGRSGPDSGRGSGGKAPEKVVTLTVWGGLSNHAALADCFREINTAFARKYPNIVLDYGYASVEDIDAAYRSGSLPCPAIREYGPVKPVIPTSQPTGFIKKTKHPEETLKRRRYAEDCR
jgi:hypothetical protein